MVPTPGFNSHFGPPNRAGTGSGRQFSAPLGGVIGVTAVIPPPKCRHPARCITAIVGTIISRSWGG